MTIPEKSLRKHVQDNPLDKVALTSLLLGVTLGVLITIIPFLKFKAIAIYLISLCIFHFLEFYITARYNVSKVNKDSFLINNGGSYLVLHFVALLELYVENLIFPNFKKNYPSVKLVGIVLIILGQVMRSMAMVTAGKSFSHIISQERRDDHTLITHGVYSISRHPSYTAFFYWAIGTELLLLNPICLIGFIITLWGFFQKRITFEERYLVSFFGDDYIKYKNSTRTWIPFI